VRKADNLPPACAVVTKSGNLNFLEASGPVQACNGTDLPFYLRRDLVRNMRKFCLNQPLICIPIFPPLTPKFLYLSLFNSVTIIKLFSSRKKLEGHLPPHPEIRSVRVWGLFLHRAPYEGNQFTKLFLANDVSWIS